MKNLFLSAAAFALLATSGYAMPFEEMFPQYLEEFDDEAKALLSQMDFQQGEVTLGKDLATISVSDEFYFLGPKDARLVLQDLWGNPEDPNVLGMLFPASISPLHSVGWGLTYHFDDVGYVSDKDAAEYDYDALLVEMKNDTREDNKWRTSNGYEAIELIGWAEPPKYNQAERTLYWAKELAFGTAEVHTLNFNIRRLGRKGVLVQNFIAPMSELDMVRGDLERVIHMSKFTEGNRYADFDPSVDKVAAVGIGGLIAGKVLAKSGVLAAALILLKKFWFVLFVPLIWLKNVIFKRRGSDGDSV